MTPLPSVRTIGRILERRGALDGRRRVRRPAPPPGWYLPDVADRPRRAGQLRHRRGAGHQGRHARSRCSTASRCTAAWSVSWPMAVVTAKAAVEALVEHWRAVGLPGYAQFDNDTIFQGPHQHPDVVGRVMRLCLSLGVVPVFVPPRETGLPGGDRELQRPVAGQGLGPVHPRVAGGPAGPVGPVRGRRPAARRGADRGGPEPSAVPRGLEAGPAGPPPRPAGLPAADRRAGGRGGAGPALRGRCRRGRTGWSGPRSISTRAASASTPCDAGSRRISHSSRRSHINCLAGKDSVNPSGSLAFPPVRDYNGRHACGASPDFLA